MNGLMACDVKGCDIGCEVIPQHPNYDRFKHVILKAVQHRKGMVVGTIMTSLIYEGVTGATHLLLVPGTTKVTVYRDES